MIVPDLTLTARCALAGAEVERARILEQIVAPLVEALNGYQLEATSYHNSCGHGLLGSAAECDSICAQMPAGASALAKAREELGKR